MSFAINAALIEDSNSDIDIINKKKQTHNKTQKKYPTSNLKEGFDTQKVNSVLERIHNKNDDEDESNLGDFNPPPPPQSAGVDKTMHTTEHMTNMYSDYQNNNLGNVNSINNENNQNVFRTMGKAPQPTYDGNDNLDLNNFSSNYGDNKSIEDYYKKMLPGYNGNHVNKNSANKLYYNSHSNSNLNQNSNPNYIENSSPDVLLQKLNYMIHLLEEKQDEKTNNVTEEVILYSFLGIFIIFVVDSFARAGKYMR